ncbi:PREDICTED: exonuclease DPD1, chloroplastic/mitochondrial isoform X2 [Tarenaya hassleriana]|nr:PREDICTED: exonuclease DPD1, chloroplastic/mitochondrial isoform X2 [Tarenaya hassleriana]
MCISISQVSRFRIHFLAGSCWGNVHGWRSTLWKSSSPKLLDFRASAVDGRKRWVRRNVSTNIEGRNNTKNGSGISGESVPTNAVIDVERTEVWSEVQKLPLYSSNVQERLAESKNLSSLLTVIVCDIETTGLSRVNERIIEFACQDLAGGENSTFQTLINPGRCIPNSHIHGIMDHMVRRPEVPRMEELIPILLQYVRSRHKPEGYVLFVAHNGRTFDFPFLINEFNRCSYQIPPNWLFLDSLPLSREKMKSLGTKAQSGLSLQALGQYYNLPKIGSAHRAMSDVRLLSLVFQRLTFDLKLSLPDIVLRSFRASDIGNSKKKKA